ncbi:hypothetical protein [Acidovorax carolinensis]|uniref:hypothetical protein n=1 Tax=Acidovorax carolinensis TaxID=553814 RepID=UPI00194FF82C|nr:hypothetical protein [Acidovorax carolinensis]
MNEFFTNCKFVKFSDVYMDRVIAALLRGKYLVHRGRTTAAGCATKSFGWPAFRNQQHGLRMPLLKHELLMLIVYALGALFPTTYHQPAEGGWRCYIRPPEDDLAICLPTAPSSRSNPT